MSPFAQRTSIIRHARRRPSLFARLLWSAALGCGGAPPAPPLAARRAGRPTPRARALADAYLDGYFERNPEQVTLYGVPGRRHDRLPDNSLEALKAWQARRTRGSREREADRSGGDRDAAAARHLRHRPRGARKRRSAKRVCRDELWTVSQMSTAGRCRTATWSRFSRSAPTQARKEALARWGALPKYIDTEIANLREGLKAGYYRAEAATSASSSIRWTRSHRDADRRFAVRFAGGARQDAGVREAVRRAGRASRSVPAFEALPRLPRRRSICRRRARRSPCPRTRTAPPATTPRSAITARCRCRPSEVHATRPARRSSSSTRR